jgi:hypothetical protein
MTMRLASQSPSHLTQPFGSPCLYFLPRFSSYRSSKNTICSGDWSSRYRHFMTTTPLQLSPLSRSLSHAIAIGSVHCSSRNSQRTPRWQRFGWGGIHDLRRHQMRSVKELGNCHSQAMQRVPPPTNLAKETDFRIGASQSTVCLSNNSEFEVRITRCVLRITHSCLALSSRLLTQ